MERAKYFFINNIGTYIAIWYAILTDLCIVGSNVDCLFGFIFSMLILMFHIPIAYGSVIYCIFMLRLKKPVTAILTPIIVLITTFKFFSVVPWPIYILVEFIIDVLSIL